MRQLRTIIETTDDGYLECFASTSAEWELAAALGVPLYGPHPALARLGRKSESKQLFRSLALPTPDGVENVRGIGPLVSALTDLKRRRGDLRRAVVKLEDSLGGVGNATFSYAGCPDSSELPGWIEDVLEQRLELAMSVLDVSRFLDRLSHEGGIVEALVEGGSSRSPSVQCEIRPDGEVRILSTHDQFLAGSAKQHFAGCSFPAQGSDDIQPATRLIGARLQREGVVGWFGVDFVTVVEHAETQSYALEINLRNLGTAHHVMTLKALTGGSYDPDSGRFLTGRGEPRCYVGSDSTVLPHAKGRDTAELLASITDRPWAYDAASQTGVVLHMVDAMTRCGRLGLTCIGRTPEESYALFVRAVRDLEGVNSLV
jgi:hypothetical protein